MTTGDRSVSVLISRVFPRYVLLALLTGAALVAAFGPGVVAANESATEADAPPIVLETGDNLVGWVGEPIAIGDVFDTIPEIEAIFYWDGGRRTWRIAAPTLPKGLWTLHSLNPGMAVVARNGSQTSVPWLAQTEPTTGLVQLHEGTNWVSWAGPSGWRIEEVVKGIGLSLERIQMGQHTYERDDPKTADQWGPINRGDALIVTVSRSVNWLQPTNIRPQILWPRLATERMKTTFLEDLESVFAFYAGTFGLQPDPARYTIKIWEQGHCCSFHPPTAVATTEAANPAILAHELFHAVQHQLAGRSAPYWPAWIGEGTAQWIQTAYSAWERSGNAAVSATTQERNAAAREIRLRHSSFHRATAYSLGQLAFEMLYDEHGYDALIEFFRLHAISKIGPARTWNAALRWEDVFSAAFGVTLESFYQRFDSWQDALPGRTTNVRPTGTRSLSGTLLRTDGTPIEGALVEGRDRNTNVVYSTTSESGGGFALWLPRDSEAFVEVDFGPAFGCTGIAIDDRIVPAARGVPIDGSQISFYEIGNSNRPPAVFHVPEDLCRHVIHGRVVDWSGNPLAGVVIRPLTSAGRPARGWGHYPTDPTDPQGIFRSEVLGNGEYILQIDLTEPSERSAGCRLFYATKGLTPKREMATRIHVADADPAAIEITLHDDACARSILGSLRDSAGTPLARRTVFAIGQYSSAHGVTDETGGFTILLPLSGTYWLRTDGACADDLQGDYGAASWTYYGAQGPTTNANLATATYVGTDAVGKVEFYLSERLSGPQADCEER